MAVHTKHTIIPRRNIGCYQLPFGFGKGRLTPQQYLCECHINAARSRAGTSPGFEYREHLRVRLCMP